ncbi:MAG: thiolase family protein [Gemmatimonadaceae bacterium]|nr:thiolase family protein [Gemmatimonadaceae bacterium]
MILSAVRTPFGTFGGTLRDLSAVDLTVAAATAAMERAGVQPADIGHSIFGNVIQSTTDTVYFARHVALKAGCPIEVPALTVNRLCGSGFQAIISGAHELITGDADVCLVGGGESMSTVPHAARGLRWGLPYGASPKLEDLLFDGLTDSWCQTPMGITAENLEAAYHLGRAAADEFALRSQHLTRDAWANGLIRDEIVPVPVVDRKTRQVVPFARDEHARPESTFESLTKLKPVFRPDGVVTAGNASGLNDGAGALVIARADWARERGLRPLARLVSWGVSGVEPRIMGIGPVSAARMALGRAGLTLDQMDLVEVNEAFATQALAVQKELGIPLDKFNLHGGAIAIGHPLGASGARIAAHVTHALRLLGKKYALGSACIGGGQGIAVVIESLS